VDKLFTTENISHVRLMFERICEERFHKSILTQTETLDWIETFENVYHKLFTLTFSFMNEPTRCWSFFGFLLDVYLKDTIKIFHCLKFGRLKENSSPK